MPQSVGASRPPETTTAARVADELKGVPTELWL